MKTLSARILGIFLAVLLTSPVWAQFQNQTPAFEAPGPGKADRVYQFRVPDGVTIHTRKGTVIKGGELIGIPGKYLKLMDPEEADSMMTKAPDNFFNNKTQMTAMTPAKKRDHAAIALTVPEGVSMEHEDGRKLKGEATLYLIVAAETMQAAEMPADAPEEFYQVPQAFQSK